MINITEDEKKELNMKIRDLMEFAQIHKLPFFLTIAIGENEEDTLYIKELFSPQIYNYRLKNDTIRKHELVEVGFDVVPPRENMCLNMEEIL